MTSGVRLLDIWGNILLNVSIAAEPQILCPHPLKLRQQINFLKKCFKSRGFFFELLLRRFFLFKNSTDWQGYASLATMYRSLSEDVAILVFSATLSLMSRDGKSTVLLGDALWKQSQCHGQFYVQIARSNRALALFFQWAFGI